MDHRPRQRTADALDRAIAAAAGKVQRFGAVGRMLSLNDVRVVVLSQLLVELSAKRNAHGVARAWGALLTEARRAVATLHRRQTLTQSGGLAPARQAPAK